MILILVSLQLVLHEKLVLGPVPCPLGHVYTAAGSETPSAGWQIHASMLNIAAWMIQFRQVRLSSPPRPEASDPKLIFLAC